MPKNLQFPDEEIRLFEERNRGIDLFQVNTLSGREWRSPLTHMPGEGEPYSREIPRRPAIVHETRGTQAEVFE